MKILEPWFATSDSRLVDEIRREMPLDHFLQAVDLSVVAFRRDRDDVLVALNDGSGRFVAIHLTYLREKEINPKFPRTRILESDQSWLQYMQAAHAAWVTEDPEGRLWMEEQKLWGSARKIE